MKKWLKIWKWDVLIENRNYGIIQEIKGEKIHEKKSWKPWGCIYIYIYIVGFNKIGLCKYSKEAMYFRRI